MTTSQADTVASGPSAEGDACPTCGPTRVEKHPQRPGVIRCANCKEWLPPASPAETAPMRRGRTERETCDLNGWGIGTRLVGDEGYGPAVIRITYFTREGSMLAITETRKGQPVHEAEHFWTLACRDWEEVR